MGKISTKSPEVILPMELSIFEKLIGERLYIRLSKNNRISINETKFRKLLKNAFQDILTQKFSTGGKVLLYQMPLGSDAASGKFNDKDIGKFVYVSGTDKHRAYLRRYIIPNDPKTSLQIKIRNYYKQVGRNWTKESQSIKDKWNKAAIKSGEYTGQTYYTKRWFQELNKTGIPPKIGFLP